jgi:signal recognition particle GTPase
LEFHDSKLIESLRGQIELGFQSKSTTADTSSSFMLLGSRQGNGKTTLISTIAMQLRIRVVHVASVDLLRAATGRQSLSHILQMAINCAFAQRPCVLILEDIHVLMGTFSANWTDEQLSQIEKMETVRS